MVLFGKRHRWAKSNGCYSNALKVMSLKKHVNFFRKICNGPLHFKALLLTTKVMAPRFKTVKINGNVPLLVKNVTFNSPFVLNS